MLSGGKLSLAREIITCNELKYISCEYEKDMQIRPFFDFSFIDDLKSNDDDLFTKFLNSKFYPKSNVLEYIFCHDDSNANQTENNGKNAKKNRDQLLLLYTKYCLISYAYIAVNIKNLNIKQEIFVPLVKAFTTLRNLPKCQSMVAKAFVSLLYDFLKFFNGFSFERIYTYIFDFIENQFDQIMFNVFPDLLQALIKEYGFETNSITAQFCSLMQIILIDHEMDEEIAGSIFRLCNPYFQKLNDCALNLLCYLPHYLDDNQVDAFFSKLPFCFEPLIEAGNPLISMPSIDENFFKFTPVQSPAILNHFIEDKTFPNGLNINQEFEVLFNNTELGKYIQSDVQSKIATILKILEDENAFSFIKTFLISFNELINMKSDSQFCFDYTALYIYILNQLKPNRSLQVPIPSIIFDPKFVQTESLHALRFHLLKSLLSFDLNSIDQLLRDLIKYPIIMTEIAYIFYDISNIVSEKVSNETQFFRLFKDIGASYQYADINDQIERSIIEKPRAALLRLFPEFFKHDNIMTFLMKDIIIIQFFLFHFFEPSLQEMIFQHFNIYISKQDVSIEFVDAIIQLFFQIGQLLSDDNDNEKELKLLTNILNTISKCSKNLIPFIRLNNVISKLLNQLNVYSELSWKFLNSLLTLLTSESFYDIKIPPFIYTSIESFILKKIENDSSTDNIQDNSLTEINNDKTLDLFLISSNGKILLNQKKTFAVLVQLLAGSFLQNYNVARIFDVKNFDVLNILFNVFQDSFEIDIFSYIENLCRYSYMNCVQCHSVGFDYTLIDYLYKHRCEPPTNHLMTVLSTVSEIISTVSSPLIVQRILSLFTPIDSQYITPLHSILVNQLMKLFNDDLNSPAYFVSLIQAQRFKSKSSEIVGNLSSSNIFNVRFNTEHSITNEVGFTFTCWIYADLATKAHLMSLYGNQLILTISVEKLIYINNKPQYIQIPKRKWTFFALSLKDNGDFELYIDSANTSSGNLLNKSSKNKFDFMNIKHYILEIGGQDTNSGRISHFGLFPFLNQDQIHQLFLLGPRFSNKTAFISKCKPFFFIDDSNLREINLNASSIDTKTFTTILLHSFRLETLLPLFAQVDMPIKTASNNNESSNISNSNIKESVFNIIDLLTLIDKAFSVGVGDEFDFSILAHLLSHLSPSNLTIELYKVFYSIYNKLISRNETKIKTNLYDNILINFDLWYPAYHKDHIKIIKFMISEKILKYNSFQDLLILLRVFYWYAPNDGHQIKGTLDSDRPRDPNLDVQKCRRLLLSYFNKIEIHESLFSTIINHCLTLQKYDKFQVYDLLVFLQKANIQYITPKKLHLIHFLFNSNDDTMICLTIGVIISIHNKIKFDSSFTLPVHLGQIMVYLSSRKFRKSSFLESCIGMLDDSPELFELCSYIAMINKNYLFYQKITPSESYCSRQSWALWSVINAIKFGDPEESNIYNFLLLCSPKHWIDIFDSLRIIINTYHLSFHLHITRFLLVLSNILLNLQNNQISKYSVETAFSFFIFSLFFRKPKLFSKKLFSLFQSSPFSSNLQEFLNLDPKLQKKIVIFHSDEEKNEVVNNDKEKGLIETFSNPYQLISNSKEIKYIFGIKIDSDGKWKDKNLVLLLIQLFSKYDTLIDNKFSAITLLAASFLLKNKDYSENIKYIKKWINYDQIQLKKVDMLTEFYDFFENLTRTIPCYLPSYIDLSSLVNYSIESHYLTLVEFIKLNFSSSSSLSSDDFYIDQESVDNVIERSTSIMEQIRLNNEINLKQWEKLWRNMTITGGPWCFMINNPPKWKRDFANCAFYCPMKLRKNNHFDIHIQASLTRELGNSSDAEQIVRKYREKLQYEYFQNVPVNLLSLSDEFDQTLNRSASISSILNMDDYTKFAAMPKSQSQDQKFSKTNSYESSRIPEVQQSVSMDLRNNLQRNIKREIKCELIKPTKEIVATFNIMNKKIIRLSAVNSRKIYEIHLERVHNVFLRRRFHHQSAIEIFCLDGKSYFINFPESYLNNNMSIIHYILNNISLIVPNCILIQKTFDFANFFENQHFTEKWCNGNMSNFEYLMNLNIFSGRSFNDISLYPFFPWIIAKFDDNEIDLNSESSFRNLSKPVGALTEERISELRERMEGMIEANDDNPYLYFSYAMCPLAVFLFLIRMEPFTTLHIQMQSGKFDHGGRIFSSISDTFNSVSTSLNNYRELPPEFFFCPEFLVNENGFDFGSNKNGAINDVILPKWAHKNPFEFIYKMRKALECDFVSAHISEWIDLIWGYKQRGEEAVKADNVYSSQLYDTVWMNEPSSLTNKKRLAEIEATLCQVGQVPPQLFKSKHPIKSPKSSDFSLFSKVSVWDLKQIDALNDVFIYSSFIKFISNNEFIVTFSLYRELSQQTASSVYSRSNMFLSNSAPFDQDEATFYRFKFTVFDEKIKSEKIYDIEQPQEKIKYFADDQLCYIFESGKLHHPFNQLIQEKVSIVSFYRNVYSNDKPIIYEAIVVNESTLLLYGPDLSLSIPFYGEKISCVDISPVFKIVVCGTENNNIFICSMYEAMKVNVISLENNYYPVKLQVSPSFGFIICYSEQNNHFYHIQSNQQHMNKSISNSSLPEDNNDNNNIIFLFNINGRLIRTVPISFKITSWFSWKSNKAFDYIVFGTSDGRIFALETFYFDIKDCLYRTYSPIKSIIYNEICCSIVALTEDCQLIIIPFKTD